MSGHNIGQTSYRTGALPGLRQSAAHTDKGRRTSAAMHQRRAGSGFIRTAMVRNSRHQFKASIRAALNALAGKIVAGVYAKQLHHGGTLHHD
jgi:hypothetical protein